MYKHNLVIEYILNNIKNGSYKIGDKIATEKELCEKLKISRITVHNAIKDLAKAGVVTRIKGKGTFLKKADEMNDFIFELKDIVLSKEQACREEHTLLNLNLINPFDFICKKLNISPNDRIYEAIRLMAKNGEVYGLDYSYISPDLINMELFKSEDFLNNSFHSFLKNIVKLHFKKISIELAVHLSNNFESEILSIPKGIPLVSWITNIIDENDNIIACTCSISKENVSLISFKI